MQRKKMLIQKKNILQKSGIPQHEFPRKIAFNMRDVIAVGLNVPTGQQQLAQGKYTAYTYNERQNFFRKTSVNHIRKRAKSVN